VAPAPAANQLGAQPDRVAYLNSQELLLDMPEAVEAEKKLAAMYKQREGQFQGLMQQYQQKTARFQEMGEIMTKGDQEKAVAEIQSLESRLQTLEKNAQNEMEQERNKLMKPIVDRANAAVKEVATELGYTLVLDPSMGGVVYIDTTRNLLAQVKAKLGIKEK
jgi:outer membrane protein